MATTKQILGKVMITNRGEYISSKSYEILDIVSYNGSSFMSKIDDNTSVPEEEISPNELLINENWQLVAKKGDTYKVTEEDLQAIAKQITDNANSAFNQNVETKTKEFNTNANSATETFNANDTKKLKEYNDNADNKLNAYNTNDTNKLKVYNTNADSKIEEYNTNANSKIVEYDKHSEELRNMAVSTDNELERVKNEILDTGSVSDTFIHVEDSCMAKLKELEIEGAINQETTTGKNLFDENNLTRNLVLENGDITTNASWNMSNYIEVSGNTNYVVKHNDTTSASQSFILIEFDADKKIIKRNVQGVRNKNIPYTITTTDTTRYLIFNYNNTYNNTMLQLEKGDTSTDYEPYTGGQPSPNPDYPQEIKTITDSLKVTSCGKNLFSVNIPTTTRGGITVSQDEDGIHVQGTSASIVNFLFPTKILNRLAGKTITLICADLTNSNIQNISFKSPAANTVYCAIDQNVKSRTYTLPIKIADDTVFSIYILSNMTINSTLKIQVKIGNISEYENYVESLIEANLPEGEFIGKLDDTYKDTLTSEFVVEDSKCHLKLNKKVGLRNFNDVSSILYSTLQNDYFLFQIAADFLPSSVMISNNFINKGNYGLNYNHESIFRGGASNNAFQFKIKKDRVTSCDAKGALSFIKNSNTDVYYALNTPYTLDLGPIDIPLAYKEVTNIFTDSDLLPKINAKYYRTFQTTIQNLQINEKSLKQEITDLNNSISDITKRLEALESANVSTIEESEASNDLQN